MSYVRVSIMGNMGTEEVWSVNPVFDPTGEFPGAVNQVALDSAALAIATRTLPGFLLTALGLGASRNAARVEVRDDVTDALLATSTQASPSAAVGTGTVRLTSQSAIVCSIRTNTPGASGRGRLYWPAPGVTVNTTYRITAPTTAELASAFKVYLQGIATDLATAFPTIGFDLSVRSQTTKTTPHAVRIQVGNIVDTQRRRRDRLIESYSALSIP